MTSLQPIITLGVSIIIPLLPIITIITYHYVFETGQLAHGATHAERGPSIPGIHSLLSLVIQENLLAPGESATVMHVLSWQVSGHIQC